MHYLGSKARHAADIIEFTQAKRSTGQTYVEPFVGGGNMMCRVPNEARQIVATEPEAPPRAPARPWLGFAALIVVLCAAASCGARIAATQIESVAGVASARHAGQPGGVDRRRVGAPNIAEVSR